MIIDNTNIIKASKTQPVSLSIDPLTTQATLGTIAQSVSESALAPAAIKGYTVIDSQQGSETYIGQYALTPKQLENAGIIKPGSSGLVESLVASGNDISKAMPPAIFTGKSGAKDYNSFVRNIPAQSNAMVKNLQVAQTSLQNAGLITGSEAPSEINGVILSTANNGLDSVLEVVNTSRFMNTSMLQRDPVGKLSETYKDIQNGNYAGTLAESGLGTLSGVQTALQGLLKNPNTANAVSTGRGLQANAYETIKNSITTLKPNTANDLTSLLQQKSLSVDTASLTATTNQFAQQAQGLLGSTPTLPFTQDKLGQGLASIGKSFMDLANTNRVMPDVQSQLPNLLENPLMGTSLQNIADSVAGGSLAGTAAGIAAGLNNLPGSLGSITSITDFSKGNTPIIPGTEDLKAQLKNLSTDAINNIQSNALSFANSFMGQNNLSDAAVNGLVDMVSSKLPAGAAALLQNAAGSIAAAGLGLKSPSAGVNTVPDRQTIAKELKNVMGDPGIPEPNYVGVSDAAVSKVENTTAERKQFIVKQKELKDKYKKVNDEFMVAYTAFAVAENNLPQGSSIVKGLKSKYEAKVKERAAVKKQLDDLYKESPEFAVRNIA